jgi:hypothetical protein
MTADTIWADDDDSICALIHASAGTTGLRPHCTV